MPARYVERFGLGGKCVTSRLHLRPGPCLRWFTLIVAWRLALLGIAGCSDAFNAGRCSMSRTTRLSDRPQGSAQAPGQGPPGRWPTSSGPTPSTSTSPPGRACRYGGIYLANYVQVDEKGARDVKPIVGTVDPATAAGKTVNVPQAGGYALYRLHCLHCHGVSGAGDGPTVAVPVSPAPRLPQGALQVHLDADRRQADPRRPSQDDPRRPARDVDARVRGADGAERDRAGARLRDLPEPAGRDRDWR